MFHEDTLDCSMGTHQTMFLRGTTDYVPWGHTRLFSMGTHQTMFQFGLCSMRTRQTVHSMGTRLTVPWGHSRPSSRETYQTVFHKHTPYCGQWRHTRLCSMKTRQTVCHGNTPTVFHADTEDYVPWGRQIMLDWDTSDIFHGDTLDNVLLGHNVLFQLSHISTVASEYARLNPRQRNGSLYGDTKAYFHPDISDHHSWEQAAPDSLTGTRYFIVNVDISTSAKGQARLAPTGAYKTIVTANGLAVLHEDLSGYFSREHTDPVSTGHTRLLLMAIDNARIILKVGRCLGYPHRGEGAGALTSSTEPH